MEKPVTQKEKLLKTQHRRFVENMTRPGSDTFDNMTRSYAAVYYQNIESLSRIGKTDPKTKKTSPSPYEKACSVCAVRGHELVRNIKISEAIKQRLLKLFGDNDEADSQHARILFQNEDKNVALSAIMARNKLMKRITDEPPVPPNASPISAIEITMPAGSTITIKK